MTDIGTLEQQSAKAQERLQQAQAKLLQAREQEAQRRDAERGKRAQKVYDAHAATEEQLREEEAQAREAFRQAVLDDPLVKAFVAYRSLRWRRSAQRDVTNQAAQILGKEQTVTSLAYRDPRLLEDIVQIAEDAARGIADDEAEAKRSHLNGEDL